MPAIECTRLGKKRNTRQAKHLQQLSMRSLVLLACLASAAAFSPGVAPPVQRRSAASVVCMKTATTKPQRVNERNRLYNQGYRSEMRTRIKNVRAGGARPRLAPGIWS